MAVAQGRQRPGLAHPRHRPVHKAHGQPPRHLREQVLTAQRHAGLVRQVMVDRPQPRRVAVAQPAQRHRRRLAREHPEPVAHRVARHVHQHVDAVVPDALGQGLVAQPPRGHPVVHTSLVARRHRVLAPQLRIGPHFHGRLIVSRQQRLQEPRAGMLAEVRRHIAHPQPPVRAPAVRVRPPARTQRPAEAPLVLDIGLVDLLGAALRVVVEDEQQVVEQVLRHQPERDGALDADHGLVERATMRQHVAQVVMSHSRVGPRAQCSAVAGLGLGHAALRLQQQAQVVQGIGVSGHQNQRSAPAGLGLSHLALVVQRIAFVVEQLGAQGGEFVGDRHRGVRRRSMLGLPTREHLPVGLLYAARESRLIHERAGLQLAAQRCACGGQCRQVLRQSHHLVDIGLLAFGDPLRAPQPAQDGVADAAHTGPACQRHDRQTLVEHLDDGRSRIVGKAVQPDVDAAQQIPGRTVATNLQAFARDALCHKARGHGLGGLRVLERAAVDDQRGPRHAQQDLRPHAQAVVIDAHAARERAKAHMAIRQCRQRTGFAHASAGAVGDKRQAGQTPRRLGEEVFAARRRTDVIAQVVVDGLQAGGAAKAHPAQRHRRRLAREQVEPVALGMAGQIDQDVDAVGAYTRGQGVGVQPLRGHPMVDQHAQALGRRIGGQAHLGIGEQLEGQPVVASQQGLEKETAGVLPEVRRDIAHPQAAAGRRWVGMGPPVRALRRAERGLVRRIALVDLLGAGVGVVVQREQQIVEGDAIVRIRRHRARQQVHRGIHLADRHMEAAQVVQRGGERWLQGNRLLEAPGGLGHLTFGVQYQTQVVERLGMLRAQGQRRAQCRDGGRALLQLEVGATQVGQGFGVVRQQLGGTLLGDQGFFPATLRLQQAAQRLPGEAMIGMPRQQRARARLALGMGATVVQVDQRLQDLGWRFGRLGRRRHRHRPHGQAFAKGLQLRARHALGLRQRQQAVGHLGPTGPDQCIQVTEPELRPPRIGIQCRLEMRQRLLRPPQADGIEHTQVVPRIRVRRIALQHRPVQCFGLLERKTAVLLDGLFQQFRDRCGFRGVGHGLEKGGWRNCTENSGRSGHISPEMRADHGPFAAPGACIHRQPNRCTSALRRLLAL